jgi:sugar/nucleoside kinase (ribokinase family)
LKTSIFQARIFHFGSISLIDDPCKSAHIAAMKIAKSSGSILSYDPNLRLALWPSAEAARNGIMSIWDQADVIKVKKLYTRCSGSIKKFIIFPSEFNQYAFATVKQITASFNHRPDVVFFYVCTDK